MLVEWVASTLHTTTEHGVSSITTADAAHLGCQQSTELTPHADLNVLVSFAERRNLVSARVPSHFKLCLWSVYWYLPTFRYKLSASCSKDKQLKTRLLRSSDMLLDFGFYYRRLGITSRSHLQGSCKPRGRFYLRLHDPGRWDRLVISKRR